MNNKSKYTVDYFIKKFKAIPRNKWHEGGYVNPDDPSRMCALGHCGSRVSLRGELRADSSESDSLRNMFYRYLEKEVGDVNDGYTYTGSDETDFSEFITKKTPKSRILAALKEIKSRMEK